MRVAMRVAIAIVGSLIGGYVAFVTTVRVPCEVLWPESNLCGLWPMLIALPAGMAAGGYAGWVVAGAARLRSGPGSPRGGRT